MEELINFESVIPNYQIGDEITPFSIAIEKAADIYYDYYGKMPINNFLFECAAIKRKSTKKVGVYHKSGKQVIPEDFDDCEVLIGKKEDFTMYAIQVTLNSLYGLYSPRGKLIVPPLYKKVFFKYNMIFVEGTDGLLGVYSKSGKQILKCEYTYIEYYGSLDEGMGRFVVCKDILYGINNEDGSVLVEPQFKYISKNLMGGYSGFDIYGNNHTLRGFVPHDGAFIIPPLFKKIHKIHGYTEHEYEFSHAFQNYIGFYSSYICVETPEGLKGLYSINGKLLIPIKYKGFKFFGKNIVIGIIDEEHIDVYTKDGECLLEMLKNEE